MTLGAEMGACKVSDSIEQSAEIEDLLGILGVEATVFRVVNPGEAKKIVQELRRTINERRA